MRREAFQERERETFPGLIDDERVEIEATDSRSVGTLVVELTRELKDLFMTEVELARTELSTKMERLAMGVGSVLLGGAIALAGLLALVASAIVALHKYAIEELWISAAIVGVAVMLLGVVLFIVGKKQLEPESLAPRRTAENVREDARLFKQEAERRI